MLSIILRSSNNWMRAWDSALEKLNINEVSCRVNSEFLSHYSDSRQLIEQDHELSDKYLCLETNPRGCQLSTPLSVMLDNSKYFLLGRKLGDQSFKLWHGRMPSRQRGLLAAKKWSREMPSLGLYIMFRCIHRTVLLHTVLCLGVWYHHWYISEYATELFCWNLCKRLSGRDFLWPSPSVLAEFWA